MSDLVALDAKLLLVARRFTGTRCSNAPIKFAVSPGVRRATPSSALCTWVHDVRQSTSLP